MSFSQVSALISGVPVGPELIAVLAGIGPVERRTTDEAGVPEALPDASDQVLVAQAWQKAQAWLDARLNDAVLQIAGSRIGPEDEDWGREEVAAGLRWSNLAASDRIEVARALASRCFLTRRALSEGRITYRHAVEIVHALEPLDDERAAEVEARLLDSAEKKTPAQLARQARREVAKADPDGAEKRHRKARKGRRVDFTPVADGMAELHAILPADDAARLRAVVDQFAGRTRVGGDTRTIDQRRADALVALAEIGALTASGLIPTAPATATPATAPTTAGPGTAPPTAAPATAAPATAAPATAAPATAAPATATPTTATGGETSDRAAELIARVLAGKHAVPPRVAVTAPLSTVLGVGNQPGDLTGYGPVPASIVRELAADGRWGKWITDPGGVVTDLGRTTYRPTARLAALVRATYPTCVFPGCSQPSYRCDLDHNVRRVDGGETSAANLVALCRRHHRAKDEAGWELVHHPATGACTWTSPAGHTYTVDPPDQGDESEALRVPADWSQLLPVPARGSATALADDPPPF
ncbi:HNH endonuclease signature motif containing protein [Cryptosporangium aurantiacum]|uniref:HNH nuclease domain-containing protein n=1 Tax=Cryptosporangium aurantiacum TaxID=134849 RepID=A0A1M7QCW0_9ACTN|nr:HNH endonuclease signature motif containing protein [Cryptosporangium aurantiacum]SHN28653.1 protein of unknown function [Cryptosporangium aurantiacum]